VKISPNHLLHRRQVTDIDCNNYKNIKQEKLWDFKNKTHTLSLLVQFEDIYFSVIHLWLLFKNSRLSYVQITHLGRSYTRQRKILQSNNVINGLYSPSYTDFRQIQRKRQRCISIYPVWRNPRCVLIEYKIPIFAYSEVECAIYYFGKVYIPSVRTNYLENNNTRRKGILDINYVFHCSLH
jgi:hypothetical protein